METFGDPSFLITKSRFTNNSAAEEGGVMLTPNNSLFITNSFYINNAAGIDGGVMFTEGDSSFSISKCTFNSNTAARDGGVMITFGNSSFNISDSTITNSGAHKGGVMETSGNSSFFIINSTLTNNSAAEKCGVMLTFGDSSFVIINSTFTKNRALDGGAVYISHDSSFTASNIIFENNAATEAGGICFCSDGNLNIYNSTFTRNEVLTQGGGVVILNQCSTHLSSCSFYRNNGSLYTFDSILSFSGWIEFQRNTEPFYAGSDVINHEGGAITSFQSAVTFTRGSTSYFSNNQASHGGAILATETTITIYGEILIASNMVGIENSNGGGISLKQSNFEIYGKGQIFNNIAVKGGGIHTSNSTIAACQPGTLQVISNAAELGGGIYLAINSKLHILKNIPISSFSGRAHLTEAFMNFTGNHANYGGAVYVADDTNSDACSPDIECFIQTLALQQTTGASFNMANYFFLDNTASKRGSNLFGGLLDRCTPSPSAEVY